MYKHTKNYNMFWPSKDTNGNRSLNRSQGLNVLHDKCLLLSESLFWWWNQTPAGQVCGGFSLKLSAFFTELLSHFVWRSTLPEYLWEEIGQKCVQFSPLEQFSLLSAATRNTFKHWTWTYKIMRSSSSEAYWDLKSFNESIVGRLLVAGRGTCTSSEVFSCQWWTPRTRGRSQWRVVKLVHNWNLKYITTGGTQHTEGIDSISDKEQT